MLIRLALHTPADAVTKIRRVAKRWFIPEQPLINVDKALLIDSIQAYCMI